MIIAKVSFKNSKFKIENTKKPKGMGLNL